MTSHPKYPLQAQNLIRFLATKGNSFVKLRATPLHKGKIRSEWADQRKKRVQEIPHALRHLATTPLAYGSSGFSDNRFLNRC
jgi:hypothetical protein